MDPTAPTAGFPEQDPKGREEALRHQAHRGGDVADPGSTFLPTAEPLLGGDDGKIKMGKLGRNPS